MPPKSIEPLGALGKAPETFRNHRKLICNVSKTCRKSSEIFCNVLENPLRRPLETPLQPPFALPAFIPHAGAFRGIRGCLRRVPEDFRGLTRRSQVVLGGPERRFMRSQGSFRGPEWVPSQGISGVFQEVSVLFQGVFSLGNDTSLRNGKIFIYPLPSVVNRVYSLLG